MGNETEICGETDQEYAERMLKPYSVTCENCGFNFVKIWKMKPCPQCSYLKIQTAIGEFIDN